MKLPWFKRSGVFFVPVTASGWLLLIAALTYAVFAFRAIDSRSHSVSDTLGNWMFQVLITGAVYTTIGFLTSRKRSPVR